MGALLCTVPTGAAHLFPGLRMETAIWAELSLLGPVLLEASLPLQVRAVMSSLGEYGLPRALACPTETEQGSTNPGQTLH